MFRLLTRGTTAQNDNFTGLTGEITYDTTAKTIRVHDGATLGGFALARADEIPTPSDTFDIDSVPDTKWTEIVTRVMPAPITVTTSTPITVSSTTYIHYIFSGVTTEPYMLRAVLVAQTDAAGYATGDETSAFGIGDYTCPMFDTYIDSAGFHVRLAIGNQTFWVAHKTTGAKTDIVNSEWKLKFRIYC